MENDNLPIVSSDELAKVENNMLNTGQLQYLLQKTPKNHIYQRKAKGGGTWDYVTGTYIKKVLNLMFGWDWSFEVVEHKFDLEIKQAYVLGKLTVNSGGKKIVKMQFGRADIKFLKALDPDTKRRMPLDIGNDLKSATTDSLKKCASELGIASDVYAPNEFKEIKIVEKSTNEEKLEEIKLLMELDGLTLTTEDFMNIERIIDQKDTLSYSKCIKLLNKHLPKIK